MPPSYTQKFRKAWLKHPKLKDWLIVQLVNNEEVAKCKLCNSLLRNHVGDLLKHVSTRKHLSATSAIHGQILIPFPRVQDCNMAKVAECRLACFTAQHCSILTIDHLTPLCKGAFDGKASEFLQMHRTKCGAIIKNVLSPYFKNNLISDIGDSPFSILIDESTDISVSKYLGIVIIYFSDKSKEFVTTFLDMPPIDQCNAQGIVDCLKTSLASFKLPLKNLRGIGVDNASVMTGINNGVHAKLKQEVPTLVLIRCVCHSLQLAVSAAVKETLPRNLEFLIRDTYDWFSRSCSRQNAYVQLYKLINDDHEPLKITRACDTRWLSIESAVDRIFNQWLELKTHFEIARTTEKCFTAELLYQMYCDDSNYLFLIFIKPILADVQRVNKFFEIKNADPTKLFNELKFLVDTLVGRITVGNSNFNIFEHNITDYVDKNAHLNLGYLFEEKVKDLNNTYTTIDLSGIRQRCVNFSICLINEIKARLPSNFEVLRKLNLLSVENTLKVQKESLTPLLISMKYDSNLIESIGNQWNAIIYNKWNEISDTKSFWIEVHSFKDAIENNPFLDLCKFAISMLLLPHSNAEVERVFSQMSIIKSKLRNRMHCDMLNSILTVRAGLKRKRQCCHNFDVPREILEKIKTKATYNINETELSAFDNIVDGEREMLIID